MKEVVSLFTDASFDDYICRGGYGIWIKYKGISHKTNGFTGYIADSNEAEAIGLIEGIRFIKSQEWYEPGLQITAATDSETVIHILSGTSNDERAPMHLLSYRSKFNQLLGDELTVNFRDIKAHINEADRESRHHVNETVDKLAKDALKYVRVKEANLLSNIISQTDYGIIVDPGTLKEDLRRLSLFSLLMAEKNMSLRLGVLGSKSSQFIKTLGAGPKLIAKARNIDANHLLEYHVSSYSSYKNPRLNIVLNSKGQQLLQLASFHKVKLPSPRNRIEQELYDVLAGVILGKVINKSIPISERLLENRSRAVILGFRRRESQVSSHMVSAIRTLCDALGVRFIMVNEERYHQVIGSCLVSNRAHKHKVSLTEQCYTMFQRHIKITLPQGTPYNDYRKIFDKLSDLISCCSSLTVHNVKGNYIRTYSSDKMINIMAGGYGSNNIPRIMIYCSKPEWRKLSHQINILRKVESNINFKVRTENCDLKLY